MLDLDIPGFGRLAIEHLVLDYNGTIAFDGDLAPGLDRLVRALATDLEVHVLTADTRGACRDKLAGLPVRVMVIEGRPEDEAKRAYVRTIGPSRCAAIGNGQNDRLMLQTAALGLAVIGPEGAAPGALSSADVVTIDIIHALELLTHPLRLKATLRT